jgi:hypothetical protein
MKWWEYTIRMLVSLLPATVIGTLLFKITTPTYIEWMILSILLFIWMYLMDIKKKLDI